MAAVNQLTALSPAMQHPLQTALMENKCMDRRMGLFQGGEMWGRACLESLKPLKVGLIGKVFQFKQQRHHQEAGGLFKVGSVNLKKRFRFSEVAFSSTFD